MEEIHWIDMVSAGFAIAIFSGGLFMLISGVWSARDK
jgi:hypothetical protein